jgi:hypothetical protein
MIGGLSSSSRFHRVSLVKQIQWSADDHRIPDPVTKHISSDSAAKGLDLTGISARMLKFSIFVYVLLSPPGECQANLSKFCTAYYSRTLWRKVICAVERISINNLRIYRTRATEILLCQTVVSNAQKNALSWDNLSVCGPVWILKS